jgi:hypothetical protein
MLGVLRLEYPRGFGRLTSLRRLSHFYVSGTKDGCKLGELKDLNQLEGSLDIKGWGMWSMYVRQRMHNSRRRYTSIL